MKKAPEETTASLAARLKSSSDSDQESNRRLSESEYEEKQRFCDRNKRFYLIVRIQQIRKKNPRVKILYLLMNIIYYIIFMSKDEQLKK